ncbi:unnamed protein product [Adineta ricciae]|uniref:Cap-specific mRNA (nucleoside-2'-O-)-methyltransferase n=1 Tax=Adineta ricciae TaxID=249248 RepID=A0A813NS67_ADIRI|nr:unnamed protein product [Adineta ricciae]CAF1237350.1 unnamed protein product [Adineta ricciae]
MSMHDVNVALGRLFLAANHRDQDKFVRMLTEILREFGRATLEKWYDNKTPKKNSLLHELVEYEMTDAIRLVVTDYKFNINIKRVSDWLTPCELAAKSEKGEICDLLVELGATVARAEGSSTWRSDDEKLNSMNIIWLDLEMTSLEAPEIMECAVIITDPNLNPLETGNWVIHFDQSVLSGLGQWHQDTFKDVKDGGNDLFADCLKSKLTREQVEEELLTVIKRHCPEKMCSLAGSSIHIDKRVLEQEMPKVHSYIHYRIIDVSSFQAIMRRWTPWMEKKIKARLARKGPVNVHHRAMDDIEWSISFMRELRTVFDQQPLRNGKNKHQGSHHNNHRPAFQHGGSELYSTNTMKLPQINQSVMGNSELYADERRLVERLNHEKNYDVRRLKLDTKFQETYDENPHLRELFINNDLLQHNEEEFNKADRRLLAKLPPFVKISVNNSNKITTTEHWGQRKLLLPEIEFLTKYGNDPDYVVIYAGAAPGIHIVYLASLFSRMEFLLFDDKDFAIYSRGNMKVHKEKFTNEIAGSVNKLRKKLLFICNVRTYTPALYGNNAAPNSDMSDQLQWYTIMKPFAALLNFRLPRESGSTEYLDGCPIIEPWASRKAMECRLLVKKDAKKIHYDHQEFESAQYYFQNVMRVAYYKHDMDSVPNEGLDHCYDCRAEIYIIQEYLKKVRNIKDLEELKRKTAEMSAEISKCIVDPTRKPIIDAPRKLNIIPKRSEDTNANF